MRRSPAAWREFLVIGDTRRRALAAHVHACAERWRHGWAPADRMGVSVEILPDTSGVNELRMHDVMCVKVNERGDVPLLTLLVPARCVPQLLGLQGDFAESSSQHAEEHSIAGRLELEAVRRLAAELSGRAPDAIELQRCVSPMAAVLRESAAARWAVALIALGEAKSPLLALLSAQLVAAVTPVRPPAAAGEPLERRRQAIAAQPVSIEALLGHAEVSVSDIAGLAVGDVIVLESALGPTGSLVGPGGHPIAGVVAGQLDGKRAIQVRGRGDT